MIDEEIIEGVIYPLPSSMIDRIERSKNIFVKYLPHAHKKKGNPTKLKPGNKLYIYESRGRKKVVGEASIKNIEFLLVNDVINYYKNKTIPNELEIKQYSKGRESKELMVLTLGEFKKYEKLMKVNSPITMAGRYVTTKNKHILFNIQI